MILNILVIAVFAAFNSGIVSLRRAANVSTAAALAETQMERYRALTYDVIYLDTTSYGNADATYKGDSALAGNPAPTVVTASCPGVPESCNPSRVATGPDGRSYRVDTYIVNSVLRNAQGTAIGRTQKKITIVVRDSTNLNGRPLTRIVSTFDCSTGQKASGTPITCPTS